MKSSFIYLFTILALFVIDLPINAQLTINQLDNNIAYLDANAKNKVDSTNNATRISTFLTPSPSYSKSRFWTGIGTSAAIYGGFSIGMWNAWYKNYELVGIHSIDDRFEWRNMDKIGHTYTTYHYARWANQGLTWAGLERKKRIFTATGVSLLLQSTIEVMDGFAKKWGFSWADMAANSLGAGIFVGQELLWQEQRIRPKMSSYRINYPTTQIPSTPSGGPSISLEERANHLYGTSPWQRFIKDYNAQTIWFSTNPWTLLGKKSKAPWLMASIGYSAANVYGARSNDWEENGYLYLGSNYANRYEEYILSLDIDFEKIPVKNRLLKTFFHLINHFKFPAPAVILSKEKGLEWRYLHY